MINRGLLWSGLLATTLAAISGCRSNQPTLSTNQEKPQSASKPAPPNNIPTPQPALDDPGFQEFSQRVQEYIQVHKDAQAGLPALKKTANPDVIAERQESLTKKITELRSNARHGDVFTPNATKVFQQAIKATFSGPEAPFAKRTLQEGDPLKGFEVRVNQVYPDRLPFTTVPPTLLLNLPRLPDEVAYRILGSDLLLVDQKTRLILDFMPATIPVPSS